MALSSDRDSATHLLKADDTVMDDVFGDDGLHLNDKAAASGQWRSIRS